MYFPSELLDAIEMAGVVAFASLVPQQKVSLFHNLQLRFSRRRPSSNEPAQREKTISPVSFYILSRLIPGGGILTCPHAEEVLYIARVDLVDKSHVDGQDRCI